MYYKQKAKSRFVRKPTSQVSQPPILRVRTQTLPDPQTVYRNRGLGNPFPGKASYNRDMATICRNRFLDVVFVYDNRQPIDVNRAKILNALVDAGRTVLLIYYEPKDKMKDTWNACQIWPYQVVRKGDIVLTTWKWQREWWKWAEKQDWLPSRRKESMPLSALSYFSGNQDLWAAQNAPVDDEDEELGVEELFDPDEE